MFEKNAPGAAALILAVASPGFAQTPVPRQVVSLIDIQW
jgi:hypothetical protein